MAVKTVEQYISSLSPSQRALAQSARQLIVGFSPKVEEQIKWSRPFYLHEGQPLCYLQANRDHLNFGFPAGGALAEKTASPLLEGTGQSMRHVKLSYNKPLPKKELLSLLKAAAQLASSTCHTGSGKKEKAAKETQITVPEAAPSLQSKKQPAIKASPKPQAHKAHSVKRDGNSSLSGRAAAFADYVEKADPQWKEPLTQLLQCVDAAMPKEFEAQILFRMPTYTVPLSMYPAGYGENPEVPLPYLSIGAQKHHLALYHMGLYVDEPMMDWFLKEYKKVMGKEADMGKSCLRLKKTDGVPCPLLQQLCRKADAKAFAEGYGKMRQDAKKKQR